MASDELTAQLTGPGAPFEIVEERIRGIPSRVWKNAPSSLAAVLQASRAHGERTFSVYEGERTSFAEHFRRAASFGQRLIDRYGIRKGDRVAIAMRNFPEWPIAFFGATAAGAIAVPLNAWGTGDELAHALEDSGSAVLVADGERLARLREHRKRLPLRAAIGVRTGDEVSDCDVFGELIAEASADVSLPDVSLGPDDDATIFYTSGTTGTPKGALGTHRNICGNAVSMAFLGVRSALRAGIDPGELAARAAEPQAYLLAVPLFHVTGCHGILLGSLAQGNKLVMMHKWDPERALELIESERITSLGGVPAMVWQLLDSPSFLKRDTSSLQAISYGGAPAAPELLRRITEGFRDATPANGYGITETSSVLSLNAGADYVARPESAGLPLPLCDLRVVDEAGRDVPRGELGELWVRGPNVVKGYWRNPAATAETFGDGWFHTGDLVRVDEDGFLYIVDRAKDVVIRGGENVYCAEVEAVLFEHPGVLEAAVIGIPHRVLGEEVAAVVRPRRGFALDEDELRAHASARLARFKVPARVWIGSEPLPRNAAGKIVKAQLRERANSRR